MAAAGTEGQLLVDLVASIRVLATDSKALFSAEHGNLANPGAAISDTTLGAARLAMRTTRGLDAETIIEVAPRYLLVPAAEPLRDYETVVRLIAGTTTAKGLTVTCRLDHRKHPVGRKITDDEFSDVNLKPDKFHGEWNYTIHPRN